VVEGSWAKSQSNHDTLIATILRRKSCTLTISYSFWIDGIMLVKSVVYYCLLRQWFSKIFVALEKKLLSLNMVTTLDSTVKKLW